MSKLQHLLDQSHSFTPPNGDEFKLTTEVNAKLFPHQKRAYCFALQQKRTMLALEMGCGKTLVGICVLSKTLASQGGSGVVVCPAALIKNWVSEIERFCSIEVVTDKPTEGKVLVTSFTKSLGWDDKSPITCLIVDEAHMVKNEKSMRSKRVSKMAYRSEFLVLLTGTPAQRHVDMWYLLKLIDPVNFKSFFHYRFSRKDNFYFAERYTIPKPMMVNGVQRWDFKMNNRGKELHEIIKPMVMHVQLSIEAKKNRAKTNLPECDTSEVASLLGKVEKVSNQRQKDYYLMEAVRLTSRLKQTHVSDHVIQRCNKGEKFIVFFYHKSMGEHIREKLNSHGIDNTYIDGTISQSGRYKKIEEFKESKTQRVAVLSLATCSTGLNMVFVNINVVAELTFHSVLHIQSEFRSHRIGQTKDVEVEYLILPKSTDDIVWNSLVNKRSCSTMVLAGHKRKMD